MRRRAGLARGLALFAQILAGMLLVVSAGAADHADVAVTGKLVGTSNPSVGGTNYGDPFWFALPGDQVVIQVFVEPLGAPVGGYQLSLEFDAAMGNGLNIASWDAASFGSSDPTIVESDQGQPGMIQGFGGSFDPPLQPGADPMPVFEVRLDANDQIIQGSTIQPLLLSGDHLIDPNALEIDPNGIDTPTTRVEPQFQVWAPSARGSFVHYGFPTDPPPDEKGTKFSTGRVCKADCSQKPRGFIVKSREDLGGSPHNSFFQTGVPVNGITITNSLHVVMDVSKLDGAQGSAAIELDTPAVPLGQPPSNFLYTRTARLQDDSLLVQTFDSENPSAPIGELPLSPGVENVHIDILWGNDQVSVFAGAVGESLTETVSSHSFPFLGSAEYGAGLQSFEKGDQAGFEIAVGGDVHSVNRKMVLDDLKSVKNLEIEAKDALGEATGAKQVKKLEEAKRKLEAAKQKLELGERVPGKKNPPEYRDPLIMKAYNDASADPKVAKEIKGRLEKAVKRDEMAIKRIDKALDRIAKGKKLNRVEADISTAQKFIQKGIDEKIKAKAVIETQVKKESKGV